MSGGSAARGRRWGPTTVRARRVRLAAADRAGRAIAALSSGGRPALVALFATLLALLLVPIEWWQTLLGLGAILLLVAAVRARVRIVIEGFDDYRSLPARDQPREAPEAEAKPGNDNGEKPGDSVKDAGSAVLLANRLAMMRELYGFVDDPDRTPTPGTPAGATVQLDDAASVLRSAVSAETTVSVGPISIPLGAAMGLLGRIVQAPRLRGAIHGDESRIIVTAELKMGEEPDAWRVESDVEDASADRRVIESMIDQTLAYEVFSDLTLQHQARWPATKYWLDALRNVAEGQRRPRNRRLLLKEAESNFVRALSEDERFYLACLNLGIIYRRLAEDQPDERRQEYILAARRVFEHAVQLRPDRWEAYHALAEGHWLTHGSDGALEMIAGLCDRALSRGPDRAASARILDLRGQAELKAQEAGQPFGDPVGTREKACRLAMHELARARLRRANPRQASRIQALENVAAQCLLNLGWATWESHGDRSGENARNPHRTFETVLRMVRLAMRLSDVDAAAHQKLAMLAVGLSDKDVLANQQAQKPKSERLEIAERELSAAARIAPHNPLFGAQRAYILATSDDRGRASEACARAERLIDFADPDQKPAQDWLIAAYRALDDDRADKLETRQQLADELKWCLEPLEGAGESSIAAYEESVSRLEALRTQCGERRDWESARIATKLGRVIRDGHGEPEERSRRAEPFFREALAWFEEEQPDNHRLARLHDDLAQTLVLRPARSGEALREAETAMILDPLEPAYRAELAHVYELGGDPNSACSQAEHALLLNPDDPALHHQLARLKWNLAETLADAAAHVNVREEAAAQFEEALKLYASDQRDERRTTSWWLAMSYFAMSRFEDVPAHLRFVLASLAIGDESAIDERGLQAVAELWLSKTYRKLRKYLEAEAHADEALRAAKQLEDRGTSLTEDLACQVDDYRWPLWVVVALAHMQVAGCREDRYGNLDEAAQSLRDADAVFDLMEKEHPGVEARKTDTYADYRAEEGRLRLAQDRVEDAIEALGASAELDPDEADVYLLLAQAQARAAEKQLEADWDAHIRRARAACRRVADIGGRHHPDTRAAEELERRLDRLEDEARKRSAAAREDGRPRGDAYVGAGASS